MADTMTVGQLIEKLKTYDPELPVEASYDSGCGEHIKDECFKVRWDVPWKGSDKKPHQFLCINIHPGQNFSGYKDAEGNDDE